MKVTKGRLLTFIPLVLLIVYFLPQLLHFLTDLLWFQEVGYTNVYLISVFAKFVIGFSVALIVFLLSYFTLKMTTKYQPVIQVVHEDIINIPKPKNNKKILVIIPSILLGLFAGILAATSLWESILLFLNQVPAGVADPVFNRDISFYFFSLSLLETIYGLSFIFLVVIGLSNFIVTMYLQGFNKNAFSIAAKRMGYFIMTFFLLLIIGFQLQGAQLLYSAQGNTYGAGYVDVKVTLPMYFIASAACLLSVITIYMGMKKKKIRLAIMGPITLVLVLVGGSVAGTFVQSMVVRPDEINKEEPYINRSIQMTNQAFNLDKIQEVEYPATGKLALADLEAEMDTIENIRINDQRPSANIYNQLQSMRLYYKFVDVDVDRYMIDGKQTQVFLSARELDQNALQDNAKTWINKHLKYTHGYGAVVSPVNKVNTQGQPELLVKDIPPNSLAPELAITRPEIYFGQLTNDYVIVNTNEKEFDYPAGDTNAESIYEGDAGIKLNLLNRVLFALDKGSIKILFSDLITSDSKILLNRNISTRVEKIAPFLTYSQDPYLVIDNGQLFWIIDGYTTSNKYPYSEPVVDQDSKFNRQNYIRNSVKVVVDAYNGNTDFYIVDSTDPLIMSYNKIFPTLFKDIAEMPEGIKEHLRYPSDFFDIQTKVYQDYHIQNAKVFYNREDAWSIANEVYGRDPIPVEPYYVNMRLPGSDQLEFLLMRPYTPLKKDNMVAWLAARNDGENYGELVLFKFPKQSLVYGPMQIESRISNDSEISKELTLWDQRGSQVIRGNLLVIPVKDSILYVEPIYISSDTQSSLPEVKQVVVAYQNKIVMETTLEEALYKIFGQGQDITTGITEDTGTNSLTFSMLTKQVQETFNAAKSASQAGNWAEYGKHLQQLEKLINQLASMKVE